MKAISQNFGHEHIATTLSDYANYPPQRLAEIIKNIDFSGNIKETLDEKIEEKFYEFLKKLENKKIINQ